MSEPTHIANSLRSSDFGFDIVRAGYEGISYLHKFGRNAAIQTGGFEAIWNGGGDYTGFNAVAAQTVELFSGSDLDDLGSTGAITIQIYGLDGNYDAQNEIITLDGQTPVDSVNTYIRMARMIVRSAGSGGSNAGAITARQKTTTANIFAVMPIGYNQTMIACYTIPRNKSAYINDWFATTARKQAGESNVRIVVRPFGEVFQVKEEFSLDSAAGSYVLRSYTIPKNTIFEKADIKIVADASVNDLGVSAGFDLILVDNG